MANPSLNIEINGDISNLQKALKQALAANDNLIKSLDGLGREAQDAGDKGAKGINKMGDAAKKTGGILSKAFDGIKDELADFTNELTGGIPMLSRFATGLGAVGLAAGGMLGALVAVNHATAELGRQARLANLDPETLQAWTSVAKQTRVSQDALIDGFKELSLRADEFVQTGSGSAAESLQRLGFSATQVSQLLQRPSDLLQEIFVRLRNIDSAGQRRILDELFGGQAAEQFVQWLKLGNGELEQMTKEAANSGDIIKNKMVAQAEELDKKFNQISDTLSRKVKTALQTVVVEGEDLLERLNAKINGTYDKNIGSYTRQDYDRTQAMIEDMQAKIARGEFGASAGGAYVSYAETIKRLEEQQIERRKILLEEEKKIVAERIKAANVSDNTTSRLPGGGMKVDNFDNNRFGEKSKQQADAEAAAAATDKALADKASKAATQEAERAQRANTQALTAATSVLQGFANQGFTPLEQQTQDLAKAQKAYNDALTAAKANKDPLVGAWQAEQAKKLYEQAKFGINQQQARSMDSNVYLSQFNPYGRNIANLQSDLASKTQAMISAMPDGLRSQVVINSAYRSIAKQTQLWEAAVKKYGSEAEARKWVAPPGHSMHGSGQAIDLGLRGGGLLSANSDVYKWINQNAASFGLAQPLSNEPWHYEVAGARSKQKVKNEEEYAQKIKESNDRLKEQGQQITEQYNPLAQRNRLLEEANTLLKQGVITQEVYNARVADINKQYQENVKKMSTANDEMMSKLQSLTQGWMDSLIDGLVDGNMNWQQFMGQIAKDLLKLAANSMLQSIKGSAGGGFTGSFGARASGGPASGWTMVGERGPELVNLGANAQVYNTPSTRAMISARSNSGSGPAPVINFNTSVQVPNATSEADRQKAARAVDKALESKIYATMAKVQRPGTLKG